MMKATTVPGAEHYREIAGMLREAARSCQFTSARKEILHLTERFESRADHLDRRAGSTTATRFACLVNSEVKLVGDPIAARDDARGSPGARDASIGSSPTQRR